MKSNKTKLGFTLAEILITLGILGIISVILVPQVLSNYRKNITQIKLKSTLSILDNAIQKSEIEKSIEWTSDLCPSYKVMTGKECDFYNYSKWIYETFISENVKTAQIYPQMKFANKFSDSNKIQIGPGILHGFSFRLNNGVLCVVYCGHIFIVPNERKGLLIGRDIFIFEPYKDCWYAKNCKTRFAPLINATRAKWTREQLLSACKTGSPNVVHGQLFDNKYYVCSDLFIQNGMEFPKDYPIRF